MSLGQRILRRSVVSAPVSRLLSLVAPDQAVVLMLHRFGACAGAMPGHPIHALRAALAYLRKHGYVPVSVDDLARAAGERGASLRRRVAFTVDDGYADFAEVAWPVFREFDWPPTVFLATGPMDGQGWFWWDVVYEALEATTRTSFALAVAGERLEATWTDVADRRRTAWRLFEALKRVPDDVRRRMIDALPAALDVELPAAPPPHLAMLTWEQARRCEAEGASFAAHTVTHPILARCTDERARWEIAESTRRLAQELRRPGRVFCYPNGTPGDFGAREEAVLREQGYLGAVSTTAGFVRPGELAAAAASRRFALPRWSLPEDLAAGVRIFSGVDAWRGVR
jgi:peptidoglycan/xylan/chitin deacetylase (PgdA/CDA1 family)